VWRSGVLLALSFSRQPLTVSMFGQPVTSTDAILVSSSKKVRSTTMGIIVRVLVCLQ
jgi:hypothetical protein